MPSLIDNLLTAYGTKKLDEVNKSINQTTVALREDPSQLIEQNTAIDLLMQPTETRNALADSFRQASAAATAQNTNPLHTVGVAASKTLAQTPLALSSLVPIAGGAIAKGVDVLSPEGSAFDRYAKQAVDVYAGQVSRLANINKGIGERVEDLLGLSDETKRARETDALVSKAHDEADAAAYQADLARGDSKIIADIKDVGRQLSTAATDTLTNRTTFTDLVGAGIGSLAPSVGIMKGLESIGNAAITSGLIKKESQDIVERAAGAIAVGSQEGGSQALQTAQAIIAMSDDDLKSTSADYNELRKTLSEMDAKEVLAGRAGITSGVWTSALAIGVGAAVDIGKFIKNPLGIGNTVGQTGRNIARETVEEGFQNPAGQFSQNLAIQQGVDPSQSLTEGLPRAAVEGTIAGSSTAGVVSAPSAAIAGTAATARAAGRAVSNRLDSVAKSRESESPVSTPNISNRIQEGITAASTLPDTVQGSAQTTEDSVGDRVTWVETPEKQVNSVTKVKQALGLSDNERQAFKAVTDLDTDGTHTRADLLDYLGQLYEEAPEQSTAILSLTSLLMDPVINLSQQDIDSTVDSITDPEQKKQVQAGIQGLNQLQQSPGFTKVIKALKQHMDSNPSVVEPVKASTSAEQVKQSADAINFAATQDINPEMSEPIDTILKHKAMQDPANAEARARLQLIKSYLDAHKAATQTDTSTQAKTSEDVSANVRSTGFQGRPELKSVLDHLKEATKSLLSGNLPEARVQLGRDLKNLAITLNNKVEALNQSAADNGKSKPYEAWNPANNAKKFFTQTKRPMTLRVGDPASEAFAQRVSNDAHVAIEAYNQMVQSHPELGLEPMQENKLQIPATRPEESSTTPVSDPQTETVSVQPEPVKTPTKAEKQSSKQPENTKPDNKQERVSEPEAVVEPELTIDPGGHTVEVQPVGESTVEREVSVPVKKTLTARGIAFFKNLASISNKRTKVPDGISALDHVLQQLADVDTVKQLIGFSEGRQTYVNDTMKLYQDLLNPNQTTGLNVNAIALKMQSLMDTFLNKKYKESTIRDLLLNQEGVDPTQWDNGHHLVLLNEDGTYDQDILNTASLAAIHWFMNGFDKASDKVAVDNAYTYLTQGLGLQKPSWEQIYTVASSQKTEDAVNSLAQELKSFLGIKFKDTAPLADTEGMLQSLAADLLLSLQGLGLFKESSISYKTQSGAIAKVNFYSQAAPIKEFFSENSFDKTLIGDLVSRDFTKPYYSADQDVPIQNTIKGTNVSISKKQATAIENMQKVVFNLEDSTAVDMFEDIGKEGYVELMGSPERTEDNTNANHFASIQGVRQTIMSAADKLTDMIATIRATGQGVKFQVVVGSNNRYMFQSPYNPQSDKMVRHVLTATKSTLDLSDPGSKETYNYLKTIAQMLGYDKKNPAQNIQDALDDLSGPLQPAVAVMKAYLADRTGKKDSLTSDLKTALAGREITHELLSAVRDFARYESTSDKSAFETSISFEADGKTDGPYNLVNLFGWGKFTPNEIALLGKGGMSFGSKKSLHELTDKVDFYDAVAQGAEQLTTILTKTILNQGTVPQSLYNVLNAFFKGSNRFLKDFSYKDHVLEFSRGLVKKGVTGATYAEGSSSLSYDMANKFMDNVYIAISEGTLTDQDIALIDALSSESIIYNPKEGKYGTRNNRDYTNLARSIKKDPLKFTLSQERLNTLANNFKVMLTDNIHHSMDLLYGDNIKKSRDLSIIASSLQSNVYAEEFLERLKKFLIINSEGRTLDKRLLTQEAIDKIVSDLRPLQQITNADGNTIVVAADALTDNLLLGQTNNRQINIASASDGKSFKSSLTLRVPAPVGVKYLAMITQGLGDGAMQTAIWQEEANSSYQTYDGLNSSLDQMDSMGQRANAASYEATLGNGVKPIAGSFNAVLTFNKGKALSRYISNLQNKAEKGTLTFQETKLLQSIEAAFPGIELEAVPEVLQIQLQTISESIDARQQAKQTVPISVDHMAGSEQPFVNYPNQQKADSRQWSNEEAAAELNTSMLFGLHPDNMIEMEPVEQTIDDLLKNENLSKPQELILKALKAIGSLDNITFVSNITLEEVNKSRQSRGLSTIQSNDSNGFYAQDENTVYVLGNTNDPEVAVHEIVHAATYRAVVAYYSGSKVKYGKSIIAIENLMSSFMDQALTSGDPTAEHVYSVIQEYLQIGNKAAALNEFMAWGLANNTLANQLQDNVNVPLLAKISNKARYYVHKIINSILGTKFNVNENYLNSLQFHTMNVARQQTLLPKSTTSLMQHNAMFHKSVGEITDLRENLLRKLTAYVELNSDNPAIALAGQSKAMQAFNEEGRQISDQLSVVFDLNTEEQATAQAVAAALLGISNIDPETNQGFHKIYREFLDQATIDNFRDPSILDPRQQEYVAQHRFAVITGKVGLFNSKLSDKSSLIPSFIALSMTSPVFRDVLSSMGRTKEDVSGKSALDEKLNSLSLRAMDKLSDMLSGSKRSKDLLAAVDGIMDRWTDSATFESTGISQATDLITQVKDTGNDIVAKGIDRVSDALKAVGDVPTPNTFQNAANVVGVLLDTNNTEQVKEGIYRVINNKELPEVFRSLVNYVVGRTDMNGAVYDMVKQSRALISRVRTIYRESIPREIASQFTRILDQKEQAILRDGLARIDVGSLMVGRTVDQAMELLSNDSRRKDTINTLKSDLKKHLGNVPKNVQKNIDDLVHYLATGETVSGMSMNAYAIAAQAGTNTKIEYDVNRAERIIDSLVTLQAFDALPNETKRGIRTLLNQEKDGMSFVISTLSNLRNREIDQGIDEATRLNGRKGYFPAQANVGSIRIESDSEYASLIEQGYTRVGDYKTSSADSDRTSKGYYVSTMKARAAFNQGALQTVVASYNGFRIDGRNTLSLNAGVTDHVDEITRSIASSQPTGESLLPIYDGTGKITGYIRDVDHSLERMYQHPGKFFDSLGSWLGRQNESSLAATFNLELANNLKAMYDADIAADSTSVKNYVNIFEGEHSKVVQDAIQNIPATARKALQDAFGDSPVMIRKDMLDNVIGARAASVRDVWSGVSNWSPANQKYIKDGLTVLLGSKAYQYAVKAEDITQATVSSLRNLIVVKSVIVPAGNMISNMFQLSMRGVNILTMPKKLAQALSEAHQYTRMEQQAIKLEARLAAARPGSPVATRLQAQLATIDESKRAMRIWPLIQNGELSTIADLGMSSEDLELTSGDLDTWISNQIDRLPPTAQVLLRYGTVSKDTALYRGLEKATLYGDFIAKAVLYEHYMEKEKLSSEDALKRITEEFVNYDVQMGRTRGYLENMGLIWFSNYKLGSIKVALDILRKNPLHALTGYIGMEHTVDTGSALTDNALNKLVDGSLFRSFGPGQGIRAPELNPFIQLFD